MIPLSPARGAQDGRERPGETSSVPTGPGPGIRLRLLAASDEERIYRWRNDPFIVERSSSQRTVTREEHHLWFARSLRDPDRRIFIICRARTPLGQVRFDRVDRTRAVISVYLLRRYVGKGYGTEAIRRSSHRISQLWRLSKIIACVREDNPAAQKAFERCGFERVARSRPCPPRHVQFRLIVPSRNPRSRRAPG